MATVPSSLKMPQELKERIARLAGEAGESTHALTLRLLGERVTAAERRLRFHQEGKAAVADMRASGDGYAAAGVHRYLDERVAGRPARRVEDGLREPVVSHGATGYLALYGFDEASDADLVARVRHQREAGYEDE